MSVRNTILAVVFLIGCASLAGAQGNPVPLINNPLVPASVVPGGPSFTLAVNGTGFVSGATVDWNGAPLSTTFISGSRLTAIVPAADIASPNTGSVTVVNPAPTRTSNVADLSVTSPRTTLSFNEESSLSTSGYGIATADFNRDGKLDLATADGATAIVSVYLGNGDGTFQPSASFATSGPSRYLTTCDFNNDGFADLAVVTQSPYSVSILLGKGDGTFQPYMSLSMSSDEAGLVAAADFNRDGNLDLVVQANGLSSIMLGNGDGTFQAPVQYSSLGYAVVVGDFNFDGKLDIATTGNGDNYVSVSLGNGDGTFQSPQQYAAGTGAPENLVAADLNGDGILDLATANYNYNLGGNISIFLGNGDGTFKTAQNYNTQGANAYSLIAGDFNGDGKFDLAVQTSQPNPLGLYATSLLLGNGNGTFESHIDYPGWGGYSAIGGGDLNNDGKLDYVTSAIAAVIQDDGTAMRFSPTQLKFSTQMVGTVSQPQVVQLTNSGSSPVAISSVATTTNVGKSGNASNDFGQLNGCPGSLQAGASCTLDVFFTPEQQGSVTGYLAVFDSGGGSPQVVPLSGSGTVVQISPKSLNFGSENVGASSPQKNIKVTNRGGKTITITGISIAGADPGDYAEVNACGPTLGPGASCSIAVIFTPTQTGTRTASVKVSDSGGGSPQKVLLSGTGI